MGDQYYGLPDAFNLRKLRPLMPRPPHTADPSRFQRVQGTNPSQLYLGVDGVGEQEKKDGGAPPVMVSSRWNPTAEQLCALEELYRCGIRTPPADQIQHITAQLRRYGKIEGKNVFYWFQNHKARERQKRRRQMESAADDGCERRELGANRTSIEVEQSRGWAPTVDSSTVITAEGSVPPRRAAKAAAVEAEFERQWEWNGTWQTMQLSFPPPSCLPLNTFSTTLGGGAAAAEPWLSGTRVEGGGGLTLQLFPARSGGCGERKEEVEQVEEMEEMGRVQGAAMNSDGHHRQFFEFLPMKN